MKISTDHELCLFCMLKMNYSESKLIEKSGNHQLFFCIHGKRAMKFHILQSWNECMEGCKYLLEWEWSREICFVYWWVVTHLWIIVCTKHLIVPSVENVHSEVLGNTISYLEVGREVMLERSQTLPPNGKSNINRYVIRKSHLRLQLFKFIYLGMV